MRYVIVGGGVAGTSAAEELRKLNPSAQIILLSQEQHPLYSRVLLPHYLKGKIPRERVFLKKEIWYEEQRIEWLRGVTVDGLNVKSKCVGLSSGRELSYDKLLIATGGDARKFPFDTRGVSYLRTLDDADHLHRLMGERDSQTKAGIYGGGFIACEYLNLFSHFQMETTIAFRGPHFWSGILEPSVGEFLTAHLVSNGVKVLADAAFINTMGNKELTGFVTSKGECACSILGIGIGIELEDAWMHSAGIKRGSDILCDEFLQTNAPDVFCAGDVAQFFDVNVGRHVRVGNWMNAQMQGRAVAKNMAGEKKPFCLVSSYATHALGLQIIFVGDVSREHVDEMQVIGSSSEGGMGQLFARAGKLIGAVLLNRNTDRPVVTKMIQERKPISDFPFRDC